MFFVNGGTDDIGMGGETARSSVEVASGGNTLSIGGGGSSNKETIGYITVATEGDASDFGDLTVARSSCGAVTDATKACFSGGNSGNNTIDKITIQTTGDATDFGDLTQGREGAGGASGD